jgi:hypothetical protein
VSRPAREGYPDALSHRLAIESWATTQECGVTGCTNLATHTWSGHPTCDDCAVPGRVARANPRIGTPATGWTEIEPTWKALTREQTGDE